MSNHYVMKVYDYFNENQLWDDIYVDIATDRNNETYFIFESWNDIESFVKNVKSVLELEEDTKDYEIERILDGTFVFSDEYTTCNDCNGVIRTSPDSYHWQPNFYIGDGFIVCGDCFREEMDYQEAYLEDKINNPKSAVNGLLSEVDIEHLGFTKIDEEYEDGWYHVNDNPEVIYNNLKDRFEEVLFYVNNVEQFRINFIVFVRGE